MTEIWPEYVAQAFFEQMYLVWTEEGSRQIYNDYRGVGDPFPLYLPMPWRTER